VSAIASQLGIDQSLFYQLISSIVFFFLAKVIFLDKLRFVLHNRYLKTEALDEEASKKFAEADELSGKYGLMIDQVYREENQKFKRRKEGILLRERERQKKSEKVVEGQLHVAKEKFLTELDQKREQIFQEKDQLAQDLVEKVTN